jgi:hypothetical protein
MMHLKVGEASRAPRHCQFRIEMWALTLVTGLTVLMAVNGCLQDGRTAMRKPRLQAIGFEGLTNGTVLSGEAKLPFNSRLGAYAKIYFVVNEGPSPMGVAIETNATRQAYVHWLTENFENGLYDVYLEADFGERSIYSVTNSIIVSNLISFDSWPVCGTQMWVFARLAVQRADWKVKVYDEGSNYIGNFAGTTTNGLINFIWDLKAANGKYLTNGNLFDLDYSFMPVGDSKPVIPLFHPDPMIAPSVYTDPIPRKINAPD